MAARNMPLKRRNFRNPQIKSYTDAIERGKKNLHIVYHEREGWKIKKIGVRDSHAGTFRTRDEAFNHAQRIAKSCRSEVIIHRRNGLIREVRSYGHDPASLRNENRL